MHRSFNSAALIFGFNISEFELDTRDIGADNEASEEIRKLSSKFWVPFSMR